MPHLDGNVIDMNTQIVSIILTVALALVSAYVAWVHHRQSKTCALLPESTAG